MSNQQINILNSDILNSDILNSDIMSKGNQKGKLVKIVSNSPSDNDNYDCIDSSEYLNEVDSNVKEMITREPVMKRLLDTLTEVYQFSQQNDQKAETIKNNIFKFSAHLTDSKDQPWGIEKYIINLWFKPNKKKSSATASKVIQPRQTPYHVGNFNVVPNSVNSSNFNASNNFNNGGSKSVNNVGVNNYKRYNNDNIYNHSENDQEETDADFKRIVSSTSDDLTKFTLNNVAGPSKGNNYESTKTPQTRYPIVIGDEDEDDI